MTYATHVLRHSKKIRSSSNLLRHDSAILVRWFSNGTRSSVEKGDGGHNIPKSFSGCNSGSAVSNNRCRAVSPTVSFVATYNGNALRNAIDPCASTASMAFMRGSSGSQVPSRRCFSTASDLPPHQEIGMPSLSPTMTEGNIARWLKKEGDKVSPGEVLCEVETDKATVEMECMEEGYLAKILRGDGTSSIKVGEVLMLNPID